MKIVALRDHKCYCCGSRIVRGHDCFAFIANPVDPNKNEFDTVYTCSKCVEEEACRVRIKRKSTDTQQA